jgi:hypothetical protein
MAFYGYRFHTRGDEHRQILHRSTRLFQEVIVDAYAQIEQNRLRWFRLNQASLRVDLYKGLIDAVGEGIELDEIGQRMILPASFTGGPRAMLGYYHDSMAIVRYWGKPDLFITMTCNPKWPEILRHLLPGQTAQDRPDLVARVFKIKLDLLLKDLTHNGVFGKVLAHMHVIEFQKRGLPHAHILLILAAVDKPRTPEDIDTIVSAELPDPHLFPALYQTVISSMLHGPCGLHNTNAPCMKDGKCSKKFPKPFADQTTLPPDQYPQYRRRDDGRTVEKGGIHFTNRDIVPYNPYLSSKYDCHINVEIATGILAVKYLYKYVYKGHDRTCFSIEKDQDVPVDEIKRFQDARYISACEAMWRILDFPLHNHFPAVQRLEIHLPE